MSISLFPRLFPMRAVSMLALLAAGAASAQSVGTYRERDEQPQKSQSPLVRELLEKAYRPDRERTFSIPEPVVNAEGERIVAKVENEQLTMEELNFRVRLVMDMLEKAEPISHPDPKRVAEIREARRLEVADQILDEWAVNTAIALQARRKGFEVSEKEIDESLARLAEGSQERQSMLQEAGGSTLIGIDESHLRKEARIGLLVEKFVKEIMDRQYTEAHYKRLYRADPTAFRIPPRSRVVHIFRVKEPNMSRDERKEIYDSLENLREELRKETPNMGEIVEEVEEDPKIVINEMQQWITADAPLPPGLHKAFFAMPAGMVSDVFETEDAIHVVKVLEREDGTPPTFEGSKPQIENYLFEITKDAVYETLLKGFDVRLNRGGLNDWREVSEEEYRKYIAARENQTDPANMSERQREALRRARAAEQARQQPTSTSEERKNEILDRFADDAETPAVDLSVIPGAPGEDE